MLIGYYGENRGEVNGQWYIVLVFPVHRANERSDFELAVTPKDLHLDDIDVDSNVSDDYAKSSDLQRGSNGSPSKESNDANDQYLSNDEMNEFNETLNMIPIENAVIDDDEMMTFQV